MFGNENKHFLLVLGACAYLTLFITILLILPPSVLFSKLDLAIFSASILKRIGDSTHPRRKPLCITTTLMFPAPVLMQRADASIDCQLFKSFMTFKLNLRVLFLTNAFSKPTKHTWMSFRTSKYPSLVVVRPNIAFHVPEASLKAYCIELR